MSDRSLYRSTEIVLSRVIGDCHTGTGNDLCRLITDNLYSKRNCVDDNLRLAIFTTKLAIKYASGVEGPIQAISHTFGERFWTTYGPNEIRQIESELSLDSFTEAMRKYWRLHNPPTRSEQARKYKGVRTPGDELTILEGVKLEELYTVSGRRRASKIFRRNTDKLQQRALLEAKRYREAHPSASRSGDDKTRT